MARLDNATLKTISDVNKGLRALTRESYHWGVMFAGVPFKVTRRIPTAATDGKKVMVNPDFFTSGDSKFQRFVLGHEVLHIALKHVGRRKGRDGYLWNIVNDTIINDMMSTSGYYSYNDKPKVSKSDEEGVVEVQGIGVYYDDVFGKNKYHWTNVDSESLYDKLVKESEESLKDLMENYDFDIQYNEDGEEDQQGQEQEIDAEACDSNGERWEDKAKASGKEVKEALDEQARRGVGLNGETRTLVVNNRAIGQKRTVFSVLDKYMSSTVRHKKNYSRPHRKLYNAGIYYPSRHSKTLNNITMVVDVSGSIIVDEAEKALIFCQKVVDKYRPEKYKVVLFDHQVEWVGDSIPKTLTYGGGTTISSTIPEIESGGLILVITDLGVDQGDLDEFETTVKNKGNNLIYLGQSNWLTDYATTKYPMVPLW